MIEPSEATSSGSTDDCWLWGCSPEGILSTICDPTAREIFQQVKTPTAVPELTETLGISRSTAYRKVESLEEAGLIAIVPRESSPKLYTRHVDTVSVHLGDRTRVAGTFDDTTLDCPVETGQCTCID